MSASRSKTSKVCSSPVAPIVGTARVVSAAGNLARALGFAIEALAIEAELDAEDD